MRQHSMQNVLIFIIFSIFAILSLILVVVGIQFYNNISDTTDNNAKVRSTVSYLENKLRSSDYEGGVDVVNIDGTDVILLSNDENADMKTAIYVSDGKLREYFAKSDDIKLGYADPITDVDSMSVDRTDNMIHITLKVDGDDYIIDKVMYAGAL